ncbi:unnamed protein product [Trifolium pratense]|uniref:Uncharacterized protein n=1 Tax=Trifolium pratense TaxID=57577 RepID=A0ACB0K782_TRIPR|nr:unnamed protein product [Trifolium pratense]
MAFSSTKSRWSLIAGRLPGRTSNDVKNYWHTHLQKKMVIEKHLRVLSKQKILQENLNTLTEQAEHFQGLYQETLNRVNDLEKGCAVCHKPTDEQEMALQQFVHLNLGKSKAANLVYNVMRHRGEGLGYEYGRTYSKLKTYPKKVGKSWVYYVVPQSEEGKKFGTLEDEDNNLRDLGIDNSEEPSSSGSGKKSSEDKSYSELDSISSDVLKVSKSEASTSGTRGILVHEKSQPKGSEVFKRKSNLKPQRQHRTKDLKSGQALLQGPLKQDLYHLPFKPPPSNLSPHAFSSSLSSSSIWHHILGHPASKIIKHLASSFQIPIKSHTSVECSSCQCAKSHKLPFSDHNLQSTRPLELIYSDVWGPAPIRSLDGFLYYVIFVDHFTKYVWLYPMKYKSDVYSIFIQFKAVVEKYFNLPIISFFSDNGGEFIKLKSFLTNHGITHLSSPPHTPELNGTAERRHRHIVETGRTLLHHANLPPQFWSYAFTTATYLINRMPTPNLNMQTPYQTLFHQPPNYNHLHSFGCLCFPWLRPYTTNKLENRSKPCIFLGYSNPHHAFLCLDPLSNRVYISRHVNFIEHSFPYHSLKQKQPNTSLPTPPDYPPYSLIPSPSTTNNQSMPITSQNSTSPPPAITILEEPVSEPAVVPDSTLNGDTAPSTITVLLPSSSPPFLCRCHRCLFYGCFADVISRHRNFASSLMMNSWFPLPSLPLSTAMTQSDKFAGFQEHKCCDGYILDWLMECSLVSNFAINR